WRHVVVVHVALAVLGRERVEQLIHLRHSESGDAEYLRLAPLEQPAAVRRGDHTDLRRNRPDVGRPAAVDADSLFDDALADELLLQRSACGLALLLRAFELCAQRVE